MTSPRGIAALIPTASRRPASDAPARGRLVDVDQAAAGVMVDAATATCLVAVLEEVAAGRTGPHTQRLAATLAALLRDARAAPVVGTTSRGRSQHPQSAG